jgi:C4-dicarboxylate transporter DctM subunit
MDPLRPVYAAFDALERLLSNTSRGIRSAWRRLRDGPLQSLLFWLLIGLTGLWILIEASLSELDRLLAWLEKAFISVALVMMVGLSFADYLRREVPGFPLEITGGAGMSVVLMVWVGFFGASLATRQRKHLAVDATDRILSPRAGRMVKRFTALIAGGFCWQFSGYATALMEENLVKGTSQEALPLWDFLVPAVNLLGSTLLDSDPSILLFVVLCAALAGIVYTMRQGWLPEGTPGRTALEAGGAATLLATAVVFLSLSWQPVQEDGTPMVWQELGGEVAAEDAGASSADLMALIGGDTGGADEGGDEDVAAFIADNGGRVPFPMWLAQSVIPLSFLLMALRFFAQGFSGRFDPPEDEEDDPEAAALSAPPPPPTQLVPSTGRGGRDLIFAGLFPGLLLGLGAALGMSTGALILLGCVLLVLIGSPLFLAIGIAAVACVTLIQDISALNVAKDMYEAVKKEELLAIPFFVLAGNIMTQGSIAERLVGVARALMGRTPGGLGLSSVFACVVFAAISGSSPVTVIAVGSIMFPMLVKERYPENYSLGVLTSAGSLGIIIPPSVPMIIYAIVVGQTLLSVGKRMIDPETGLLPGGLDESVLQLSPNDLFIAGVLPGMFIAGMLALYTLYQTRPSRTDIDIAPVVLEGGYLPNLGREIRRSWLSLLLPIIVLGGIYGILGPIRFTVTEAAAVAVVYALFVELIIHRELKLRELPRVLSTSGVMMGGLFLIIVLAIAFNKFLAEQYIPQDAAAWIQSHVDSPWQFLILVNIFLLLLGCVMDIISAILIVAPLLAPIALSYGIHPLHFGIMFIVNLELGYLTPPLGINLFVSSTVFNRPVTQVIRAIVPFLLLMLFCLAVIIWFPWLSLALIE